MHSDNHKTLHCSWLNIQPLLAEWLTLTWNVRWRQQSVWSGFYYVIEVLRPILRFQFEVCLVFEYKLQWLGAKGHVWVTHVFFIIFYYFWKICMGWFLKSKFYSSFIQPFFNFVSSSLNHSNIILKNNFSRYSQFWI